MADSSEARKLGLLRRLVRTIGTVPAPIFRSSQIRVLLAGLILTGCVSSQAPQDETRLIPLRVDCTASEAIPAALEDFISRPNRFIGKCIHVRGFVAFREVVPSLEWLYAHSRSDERAAVYGESPASVELWRMRNYADLVGYAYSCEQFAMFAQAQAEKDNEEARKKGLETESFPFISGQCHYRGGPLLWVSQITVEENSPVRLFGPTAANHGDLTPMRPSTPHAAEIASSIGPMFEFIRKQDKAGLEAHLVKIGDGNAPYNAKEAVEGIPNSFSFLQGAPRAPDVHYLVPKQRIRGAAGNYGAVGCVCKGDDCAGKWPIAELDTSNELEWPYGCIRAMKEDGRLFVQLY